MAHNCSEALWLQLAQLRGDQHPDDASAVYRRRLDRALEPARNDAYDEVFDILTALAPLHEHAGRSAELHALVEDIRTDYKRRRNLMARLDRAGL